MIRNWFNNLKDDFVIYWQLITVIITCSLLVTAVYSNGFVPSSIGWMSLNGLKHPELHWPHMANLFCHSFCSGEKEDPTYLFGICWTSVCLSISKSSSSDYPAWCRRFREMASAGLGLTVLCRAFHCCCNHILFMIFLLERWELQPWRGTCGHIIWCV